MSDQAVTALSRSDGEGNRRVPSPETRSAYDQLSEKRRRFVNVLSKGFTKTEAARQAGYGPKRPDVAAARLMAEPLVRAAVDERRLQAAIDAGVESVAVLMRLVAIATDPTAKNADRLRADELLGKHLGLFTERYEHAGKDGAPLIAPVAAPVILMTPEAAAAIAQRLMDGV